MFHKFEQGFAAIAWTFIRMGRIREPEISPFTNVMQRFKEILKKDHGIHLETRVQLRMKRLCQNLAILRASQIMYFTCAGECANQPFHPLDVLKAEKYMICTEELAIHAIGLEFDTVVSRNERKVLSKIWSMHKANEEYKVDEKGEDDYNYLALTGNIKSISKKLLNALQEDALYVSTCNIETILRELLERTLDSKEYTDASDTFDDGSAVNDGCPGQSLSQKKFVAADATKPGKLFLHLDLFRKIRTSKEEFNVYKECVKKLAHEYSDTKKMILGLTPYDVQEPWRWDFLEMKPKNGNLITLCHGVGDENDSYGRVKPNAQSKQVVRMDLDVFAAKERSKVCGYTILPYTPDITLDWDWEHKEYPRRKNKRKR